ncbi:hypothetical protein WMY93_011318 [Mugilogobius chulae]|uniref:Uncharacterized protein n=1 Tax=Mugilogobius chulae TaxID=88201 RepID=A0AAW0P5N8_9GOBI
MDTGAVITVLALVLAVAGVSQALHAQGGMERGDIVPSGSLENKADNLLESDSIDNAVDESLLTMALKALLFGSQREARNSVLHQPQRFGRNSRGQQLSRSRSCPKTEMLLFRDRSGVWLFPRDLARNNLK